MAATHSAHRRLLLTVDMERYSSKDNRSQYEAQSTFRRALDSVLAEYAVTIPEWDVQRAGDSVLALLQAEIIETATIVGPVAIRLDELLREHNRDRNDLGRVRLRMAVHEGAVNLNGSNGFPGDAVNLVCRLRDATILKDALKAYPEAGVALIVSPRIYDDVVNPQYCDIRRDRFHNVPVVDTAHDLRTEAWISVIGEDVGWFLERGGPAAPQPEKKTPTPTDPMAGFRIDHFESSGAVSIGPNATSIKNQKNRAKE